MRKKKLELFIECKDGNDAACEEFDNKTSRFFLGYILVSIIGTFLVVAFLSFLGANGFALGKAVLFTMYFSLFYLVLPGLGVLMIILTILVTKSLSPIPRSIILLILSVMTVLFIGLVWSSSYQHLIDLWGNIIESWKD